MPDPSAQPGSSPAELLAIALGNSDDGLDLESELDLGAFLCACPELQLHGCLGRGGMGVVYRARQVRLDRDVAVKLMNPVLARDPEFAQRFEREAKALARLDHPGIVSVHEFGQAAGVYYLVMELVEGPNLRELMRLGITPEQASELVGQLCDALAYAHDRGVVHRDIKPENVLVDRHGRVRVADFGLAKMQREEASVAMRTRHVMGTPQYMAPEQVRDPGDVDHRSDIFAIGVVFYELLTGQLPVGRFPPPSELGPGNTGLDAIVMRALEFDRKRRYQSASEIGAALASGVHVALPTIDVTAPTLASVRPPSRRYGKGFWLASGGAVAAGTALAIGSVDRQAEREPEVVEITADEATTEGGVAAAPLLDESAIPRWPARALATLDAQVAGVVGVDWGEIRQAPLVVVLREAIFADDSAAMQACKRDVIDHTHKVLVGLRADGALHEISVHGEWTPEQLKTCFAALEPEGNDEDDDGTWWKSEQLNGLVRFDLHGDSERSMTVGRRDSTIVASFDPAVTDAEMQAKLDGVPSSVALRDRVAHTIDLAAPIWLFAEPGEGVLPLEMVAVSGVIELWDDIAVQSDLRFASDAAASKAKTLIEGYATVATSLPEFPAMPTLEIEQRGDSLHVGMKLVVPLEKIRAELDTRLEAEAKAVGRSGELEARLSLTSQDEPKAPPPPPIPGGPPKMSPPPP